MTPSMWIEMLRRRRAVLARELAEVDRMSARLDAAVIV